MYTSTLKINIYNNNVFIYKFCAIVYTVNLCATHCAMIFFYHYL